MPRSLVLACAAALFAAVPAAAQDKPNAEGWFEVTLKFVPCTGTRPKEGYEFLPVTTPESLEGVGVNTSGQEQSLGIRNGDKPIRVTTLETSLEIDINNDGKLDAKAKGKDTSVPCKLTAQDGTAYDYMFRVTRIEGGSSDVTWIYQRSCLMEGTFDKTKIRLVDDNSDGVYGQIGRDAIAIGNTEHAAPLGNLLNVNNKIYQARVNPTGTKLELKPWTGDTGRIDAVKEYVTVGKLVWAVFRSGDTWFDCAVSGKETEVVVPVGTYRLDMGRVYNRPQGARIRAGGLKEVEVKKDQVAVVTWGGPVKLDFDYTFEGRILKIAPNQVRPVGRGGEEYWRCEPEDVTPKVHIRNKNTKKIVHRGNMIAGGSGGTYHPRWWMWRTEYSEQVKNEEGPFEVFLEEDQFTKLFKEFMVGDWK